MLGVQAAILGITCFVVILLLITSPFWMRALIAIASVLWRQVGRTDRDLIVGNDSKDVIEGEFREVEK